VGNDQVLRTEELPRRKVRVTWKPSKQDIAVFHNAEGEYQEFFHEYADHEGLRLPR
jgi:hypothetical protein